MSYHTASGGDSQCGLQIGSISFSWQLLEIQILRSPDLLNQELWGWSPTICVLLRLPGDSDAHLCLKTIRLCCYLQ